MGWTESSDGRDKNGWEFWWGNPLRTGWSNWRPETTYNQAHEIIFWISYYSLRARLLSSLRTTKKSWLLSRLPLYVKVPHMLSTLKPYSKTWVFQVKIIPDTGCCRSKFKILLSSIVICVHFNKVYIWPYAMNICHYWISIVKDNENCLLLFIFERSGMFSWHLGTTEKLCLARGKKKVGPLLDDRKEMTK
jgi:hypothetical protein